jgi:hypothetical protein
LFIDFFPLSLFVKGIPIQYSNIFINESEGMATSSGIPDANVVAAAAYYGHQSLQYLHQAANIPGNSINAVADAAVAAAQADQEVLEQQALAPSPAKPTKKCAVLDCDDNTNGSRTLCSRHQKRKERGEELILKDNMVVGPSRKKQYTTLKTRQKQKRFKDLHDTLLRVAGEKEEISSLIQEYQASSYYTELAPAPREVSDKNQIYETIGQNAIELYKSLPPRSPFRRALLCYLGQNIKQGDFAEICEVNPRTLRYAYKAKEIDIFKTTKYKVNLKEFSLEEEEAQESGQAGVGVEGVDGSLPPPLVEPDNTGDEATTTTTTTTYVEHQT